MIKEIEIIVPDNLTVQRFQLAVSSYFEKIKINQTQIRTLTTLRHTLLPKLMSGEIEIK
jgi:type I restriction enzyme S subunit